MVTARHAASRRTRSATAGSWLALLATTTLGDAAGALHARVRAAHLAEGEYRLIVQSYDTSDGRLPGREARPVGSAQRVVTADELRAGVRVDLLELRGRPAARAAERPVVVAWVEAGDVDLEFDARAARPGPGSLYGVVKRPAGRDMVQISIHRKIAA
jgi:hypothetical protein